MNAGALKTSATASPPSSRVSRGIPPRRWRAIRDTVGNCFVEEVERGTTVEMSRVALVESVVSVMPFTAAVAEFARRTDCT
jgi:hypothetical protein